MAKKENNSNNGIGNMKYWVQHILPQVYEDSLSYQELLAKVVFKLNETIDLSNATKQEVDELYDFIHSTGLQEIVDQVLEEWYTNGKLEQIINDMLFSDLNNQIKDNEIYAREATGYGVIIGLQVEAQENPDMSVMVKGGVAHTYVGKRYSQPNDMRVSISPANGQYARWDIVYISPNGQLKYLSGVASQNPVKPTVENGSIILAYIYVNSIVTYILQANIETVDSKKITLPELIESVKELTEVTTIDINELNQKVNENTQNIVDLGLHVEDVNTLLEQKIENQKTYIDQQDGVLQGNINELKQEIDDLQTYVDDEIRPVTNKIDEMGAYNRESTGYGVYDGLKVEPQVTPNMSVMVQNGIAHTYNGFRYYQSTYKTVNIEPTDGVYPRIDVVYISADGVLSYGKGIPNAVPVVPNPVNGIVLAEIYVSQTTHIITNNEITDSRNYIGTIPKIAKELKNTVEIVDSVNQDINNIKYNVSDLVVNVRKYGAKCDGITDDSKAIQDCIDDVPFGATILIGNCRLLKGLTITKDLKFKGEHYVNRNYTGGYPTSRMLFSNSTINTAISSTYSLSFENIVIQGFDVANGIVVTDNSLVIDNSVVQGFGTLISVTKGYYCKFSNSYFGYSTVGFIFDNCYNITFNSTTMTQSTRGIVLKNSSNLTMNGGSVEGFVNYGIRLETNSRCNLFGTYFEGTTWANHSSCIIMTTGTRTNTIGCHVYLTACHHFIYDEGGNISLFSRNNFFIYPVNETIVRVYNLYTGSAINFVDIMGDNWNTQSGINVSYYNGPTNVTRGYINLVYPVNHPDFNKSTVGGYQYQSPNNVSSNLQDTTLNSFINDGNSTSADPLNLRLKSWGYKPYKAVYQGGQWEKVGIRLESSNSISNVESKTIPEAIGTTVEVLKNELNTLITDYNTVRANYLTMITSYNDMINNMKNNGVMK